MQTFPSIDPEIKNYWIWSNFVTPLVWLRLQPYLFQLSVRYIQISGSWSPNPIAKHFKSYIISKPRQLMLAMISIYNFLTQTLSYISQIYMNRSSPVKITYSPITFNDIIFFWIGIISSSGYSDRFWGHMLNFVKLCYPSP